MYACMYGYTFLLLKLPEQKAATFAATLSFPLDAESPDYYYGSPNDETIGQYFCMYTCHYSRALSTYVH